MKLISVIVPFYNEIHLIRRSVNSAVSQMLPPEYHLEVVIGNDGDYSESQIRNVLSPSDNRVCTIVINTGLKGAGGARNAAIEASRGTLLAFLDADDYWIQDKLLTQLAMIRSGANFVAGIYQFEGTDVLIRPPRRISRTIDLLRNTNVGTSTVLITKELLGNDRFSNLKFSQDTEFWARLAGKRDFRYAPTFVRCTIYAPSLRTVNKLEQSKHFYLVLQQFDLPFIERFLVMLSYSVRGVTNHYIRRFF